MTRLYELTTDGRKLVDDERFLSGSKTYGEEKFKPHRRVTDCRGDVDRVRSKLNEAMDEYEKGAAKIDQFVAPTVHDAIDLPPRHAAREGIWHYLAVVEFPDFVRYRWPPDDSDRTKNSMREKFLGQHRDVYSNAIHRLWWIAELTYDRELDDEYEWTKDALRTQRLANTIFDRDFHRSPGVVKACVAVLAGESNDVIEEVTYRVNHGFSAVSLEAMPPEEIIDRIKAIHEDIE